MLDEMNALVKIYQSHTMYIPKITSARKLTCLAFDNFNTMQSSFIGPLFTSRTRTINIDDIEKKFKFDEKGIQCIIVHGHMSLSLY